MQDVRFHANPPSSSQYPFVGLVAAQRARTHTHTHTHRQEARLRGLLLLHVRILHAARGSEMGHREREGEKRRPHAAHAA